MPYTATFTPETLTRADVDAWRGALVLEFGTNRCGRRFVFCFGLDSCLRPLGKRLRLVQAMR